MAENGLIGVVTVTFNSEEVLPDFLRCMELQTYADFLLITVDNSSRDQSVVLLEQWADPRLRLITNPDNRGVAEANNQGISAAIASGCSHILLVNNDVEFSADLLEILLTELQSTGTDMVCPKMMYFDEPTRIWAAGGTFEPWRGYRSVHIGEDEIDRGQHDTARLCSYTPTCCVLICANVFQLIGQMDVRYFVYVDDTDFFFRAMKARLSLLYTPKATLLHKVGRLTGGSESPFAIHYGTRNRLFFLLKHFGVLTTIPWMIICQMLWTFSWLSGRKNKAWYGLKQKAFRASLRMTR